MKYLRSKAFGCKDIGLENQSLLNSFVSFQDIQSCEEAACRPTMKGHLKLRLQSL